MRPSCLQQSSRSCQEFLGLEGGAHEVAEKTRRTEEAWRGTRRPSLRASPLQAMAKPRVISTGWLNAPNPRWHHNRHTLASLQQGPKDGHGHWPSRMRHPTRTSSVMPGWEAIPAGVSIKARAWEKQEEETLKTYLPRLTEFESTL